MHLKPSLKIVLLAVAFGAFAASSQAQWQWTDKDGRKVFSDRPPPADIAPKNILIRPAAREPVPPAEASAPAARPAAPKLAATDARLEAKKKQAEDDELLKKKAEEEQLAKARSDNCDRAKKTLATIESGVRISLVNAKGERYYMDDTARAAESSRLRGIAQSDCAN